jgi:hypothetical protein
LQLSQCFGYRYIRRSRMVTRSSILACFLGIVCGGCDGIADSVLDQPREITTAAPSVVQATLAVADVRDGGSARDAGQGGPNDEVELPGGRRGRRECGHEIPLGASVDPDGETVRMDGRIIARYPANPRCQPMDNVPAQNGWVDYATQNLNYPPGQGSPGFNRLWADFDVPLVPPSNSGQLIFLWPGLENLDYLVQPVLQYGINSAAQPSGYYYNFSHFYVYNHGANYYYTTPVNVYPGDHLETLIDLVGRTTNYNSWFLYMRNVTRGGQFWVWYSTASSYPYWSEMVLEAKNLSYCNQYPGSNYTAFYNIYPYKVGTAWNNYVGAYQVPWTNTVTTGTPQCGDTVYNVPGWPASLHLWY